MKITTDQILALHPCDDWTRERIDRYIGDGKTPSELSEIITSRVGRNDARWLVSRLLSRLDRIEWACRLLEQREKTP